jgi:GT2 family glycosyltransferase
VLGVGGREKIVVLGMLTRIPVAGIVALTVPYLIGLERLGYDVYYVEQHGANPSTFMVKGDGSREAAAYLNAVMQWFGFGDKWSFWAGHSDGRWYGMSERRVQELLDSAVAVLNMHGGTTPLPTHPGPDRMVFVDTDPVGFQVLLDHGDPATQQLMEAHGTFFTWGQNIGNPDCLVPPTPQIEFHHTRMPVLLDLWDLPVPPGDAFTTVGRWSQYGHEVEFEGELYTWSKHFEWFKFIDLPKYTDQRFELALSGCDEESRRVLEAHGWTVREGLQLSGTLNAYRRYLAGSRGELTVAKDQNIRLRSGWFSDRSAAYLACGRPVITQETGFSNVLPTGEGLFGFSTMDEVLAAVEEVNGDYERHCRAAREIAREYFDADRVLADMLDKLGLPVHRRPSPLLVPELDPFPLDLDLAPLSRRPIVLPDESIERILARPLPFTLPEITDGRTAVSIVVPVRDNLVLTRLCLESVLGNTSLEHEYELIIVDNGSSSDTAAYLESLGESNAQVRVIRNEENRGFAGAVNQGLAAAAGEVLVLLNNDVIVVPGWLDELRRRLEDTTVGLLGPLANRGANEAEVGMATYRTYGELLEIAARFNADAMTDVADVPTLTMFCTALRRDVYERVGPLDERFGLGLFEDDDYSLRVRGAGYRLAVADGVFVHHFGQATVGDPTVVPDYGALFYENRSRFEAKWGMRWQPRFRREEREYVELVARIRDTATRAIPADADVFVVSRGDDALLELEGRRTSHFPQRDGVYAGSHPSSSDEAIAELEQLRSTANGGPHYLLFPQTSLWWLDFYGGLRRHLDSQYRRAHTDEETCVIYELERN